MDGGHKEKREKRTTQYLDDVVAQPVQADEQVTALCGPCALLADRLGCHARLGACIVAIQAGETHVIAKARVVRRRAARTARRHLGPARSCGVTVRRVDTLLVMTKRAVAAYWLLRLQT